MDAVFESWKAASTLHGWLAAGALLYFALTAYVMSRGGRIGGRGWLMDPLAPCVVFLGFLVACTWTAQGALRGMRAAGQVTPLVLAATMLALVVAGAVRMVAPGGARAWWLRAAYALVSAYAAAGFVSTLLTGHALWPALPWWLQGTWIGASLLLPIAFLRELGASIARLAAFPYVRWMFVFGCGCWIAYNLATL